MHELGQLLPRQLQVILQAAAVAQLLAACQLLIEELGADPDEASSVDPRTPRSIGVASSVSELRQWFEHLGAFLGRYRVEKTAPLQRSATCIVPFSAARLAELKAAASAALPPISIAKRVSTWITSRKL